MKGSFFSSLQFAVSSLLFTNVNMAKTEQLAQSQRIRIRLQAYDHKMLDTSLSEIIQTAKRTGASISGPVLLPTRIKKYTVLRSPMPIKSPRAV